MKRLGILLVLLLALSGCAGNKTSDVEFSTLIIDENAKVNAIYVDQEQTAQAGFPQFVKYTLSDQDKLTKQYAEFTEYYDEDTINAWIKVEVAKWPAMKQSYASLLKELTEEIEKPENVATNNYLFGLEIVKDGKTYNFEIFKGEGSNIVKESTPETKKYYSIDEAKTKEYIKIIEDYGMTFTSFGE